MDFTGLIVLGALWFLLSLLSNAKKKPPRDRDILVRKPTLQRRTPEPLGAPDATQREGSRLELVLRELGRALEQAGAIERPTTLPQPAEEELEERESLETEPEVTSLETDVRREPRRRVDQDEEAEGIEDRRIAAAAARDKPRSKADHVEFDQRIRQEAADKTATSGYTLKQLRDAVVWREILGPPVSTRDEF